jgi:cyclin T
LCAEQIPQSNEGKDWFWYVDKTVSLEQLEQLTAEFLVIFDKCPTKLKRKIMSISATQNPTLPPAVSGSLFVSNLDQHTSSQKGKSSLLCKCVLNNF